jgi:flagellum-specific ATP synthase
VLKSVSRTMPSCNSEKEQALITEARRHLSIYEDMAELIRLGAYRPGTDAGVDEAIRLYPELESFMKQGKTERSTLEAAYQGLERILKGDGKGRAKS